jgi:hypothetical protein
VEWEYGSGVGVGVEEWRGSGGVEVESSGNCESGLRVGVGLKGVSWRGKG